jgi:hypothetical protein
MNPAEPFLLDQIPRKTWPLIATTFVTAYQAAALLIANEPILSVRSAQDNNGRIIAWATDLGFEMLIKSGRWTCDFRWRPFAKPTGHYLEIILSHSVVTISQIADHEKQPRDVMFRANKRLNNQYYLDLEEFADENMVSGVPHILMVHGYQNLDFVHLGIPYEKHSSGYLYKTENLLTLPHEIPSPHPPPENTDMDINEIIKLKEEIDKWRKDNGQ